MKSVKRIEIIGHAQDLSAITGILDQLGLTTYAIIRDVVGRDDRGHRLTDDELTVYEVPGKEFFSTVAALLETDADGIKARMKNLGYTAIPGKPDEKVAAYRRLRDGAADAAQDDLFGDAAQPPAANGAYQE